ncbi:isopeptide-forming domain-containing fimbrial protein [Anaerolactibacter massiliensis]|uniref:isopeptide-forming domain-containing fimbrial protein n=1 Tax=Anaerolactibacter massiliensis TaxID=2044573 RepID=UPI000CF86783|nr:isopeptide-forming domain-containing fimbrial protein [Anaerolactibacter massiliensis]
MTKQITKHFTAFFLSLLMALSMGLTAFAEGYSLTLTGTATGHTYEAYQIFTGDLSTKEDGTKVLSNVKWGTGVTYNGTESAADVAKALGGGTMTIAQLEEKLTLIKPVKTVTSAKDKTVIDGLAAGYYLVKDQNGSQADKSGAYTKFIVQVVGDAEVKIKSDVPTVVKKVQDKNDSTGETSGWQDSADYDIGDVVPYQITGSMPSNIADYTTYKYVFTDTMSKGLTYTAKNAKITIGNTDVTSSFKEEVTTKDGSTVVTWTCENLKGIEGVTLNKDTKVVVTYSAKLNENAVIGSAGNPNTVNLTYSNNPNKGGEGDTGKTPDDKNIVFTYKVVVNKVNEETQPLAGAEFTLSKVKSDKTEEVVQTFTLTGNKEKDATTFTSAGLDDGTYVLKETKTPEGYNTIADQYFCIDAEHSETADVPELTKLSGDKLTGSADTTITFAANITEGSLTTNIVNKKGSTLPSTGGIGTTIFYVAGCAMVVLAGVMITARKKAN